VAAEQDTRKKFISDRSEAGGQGRMRKKLCALLALGVLLFFFLGAVNNLLSSWLVPIIGDSMDWHSRWLMGEARHQLRYGESPWRPNVRNQVRIES
jgi:hypothetical protein